MNARTRVAAAATAVIALAAATALLAGCAATPSGGPSMAQGRIAGDWMLVAGADADGAFDLTDATITLIVDGESAGGRSGCNTYGGAIDGDLDALAVGEIAVTEMACMQEGIMQLEQRYLAALALVERGSVGAESLLLEGDGVELAFDPIPAVPIADFVDTTWRLESLLSGSGDDAAASNVTGEPLVVFHGDGRLTGDAGCREFSGRYEVHHGEVTTDLEVQSADCPSEFVDQENHILEVLGSGFRADVDGQSLVLSSMRGPLALEFAAAG